MAKDPKLPRPSSTLPKRNPAEEGGYNVGVSIGKLVAPSECR
jgi:hypothetical protein